MPDPQLGEDREDFLDRCIPQVVREGYDPDQAVAICISYYEGDKDKAFDIPADNRIEYWKAFDRRRQSFETKYSRRIYRAIKEMLSALDDATNANELQKPLNTSILEEAYVDLYTEVGDRFARSSYAGLKRMQYEETKQDPVWIERMRKYALIDASDRIVLVADSVKREVNKIIVQGLEAGLSIPDIRDRIMGVSGLPPLNGTLPVRATRIARTEIISASNLGSLEGALSTGLEFRKQWLSTPDDRTRPDHVDADGQQVDKGADFTVGGDSLTVPGDPKGSAEQVINCRCTQIYVTE